LGEIPQALTFIDSSVKRMETLMNSVLVIAEHGNRGLEPVPIDMNDFVQNILRSFGDRVGQQGGTVRTGTLVPIVADRSAMEMILYNLIDNALKYREPGRTCEILIAAEEKEEEVICHVHDNGRGIAQEDLPMVFDIFRRVGSQDTPGEGMGLAYVKTLVRRHGGRIWCESELGKGSTFSFTVPLRSGTPRGGDQR
jgi:signal transduction histidine kinase